MLVPTVKVIVFLIAGYCLYCDILFWGLYDATKGGGSFFVKIYVLLVILCITLFGFKILFYYWERVKPAPRNIEAGLIVWLDLAAVPILSLLFPAYLSTLVYGAELQSSAFLYTIIVCLFGGVILYDKKGVLRNYFYNMSKGSIRNNKYKLENVYPWGGVIRRRHLFIYYTLFGYSVFSAIYVLYKIA